MIKIAEFIKNRSFEIAWAIFRCAGLVKHEELKKELETAAIKLAAKYGDSSAAKKETITDGEFPEIEKLISLIRLSEAIGEIKIINARVLYRELSNLNEAIKEGIIKSLEEAAYKPENEVFIEGIFSTSSIKSFEDDERQLDLKINNKGNSYKKNDLHSSASSPRDNSAMVRQTHHEAVRQDSIKHSVRQENKDSLASSLRDSSAIIRQAHHEVVRQSRDEKNNSAIVRQANHEVVRQSPNNQAVRQENNKIVRQSTIDDNELVPESWEDLIYRKIREVKKASTKEISAFFPEISERTIRFYLQRLQDMGLIEKMGTTGPGSYYMFKK